MNTGTTELFIIGGAALLLGVLFLSRMVRELAKGDRRKWIFGIILGTGIIAFALKIVFIVSFSQFPNQVLSLFPEREQTPEDLDYDSQLNVPSLVRTSYTWQALPEKAPSPPDNPMTPEKVELGRKLFNDMRLSGDGTLSCASCHGLTEELAGGDGLSVAIGISNQKGTRNSPTVLNSAFQRKFFWDGRADSLEEQAKGPIVNPIEMGMPSLDAVVEKLEGLPEYKKSFETVFNSSPSITIDNIAKAIASYERTLITPNSPYDRFVRGESTALNEQQLRGMSLFESVGCIQCHSGPNFSGASIFNENAAFRIFPANDDPELVKKYRFEDDPGARSSIRSVNNKGVWRIPTLRNISLTAPYFHNGSVDSLEEAVRIMARLQLNIITSNSQENQKSIEWSAKRKKLSIRENQSLTDSQIDDIVAFLVSLEGDISN